MKMLNFFGNPSSWKTILIKQLVKKMKAITKSGWVMLKNGTLIEYEVGKIDF